MVSKVIKGVDSGSKDDFLKSLNKLFKLCKRIELDEPTYTTSKPYDMVVYRGDSLGRSCKFKVSVFDVTLNLSDTLSLAGGWTLEAMINHEQGLIVKVDVNSEIPKKIDTSDTTCDFCKTKRRRKKTFLVKNILGEWRRVGGACVKKHLGVKPESFFRMITIFEELNTFNHDEFGRTRRSGDWDPGLEAIELSKVITVFSDVIKSDGGYIKNKWESTLNHLGRSVMTRTNQGESTVDRVLDIINTKKEVKINDRLVKKFKTYMNNIDVQGNSNYDEFMQGVKELGEVNYIRLNEIKNTIPKLNTYYKWLEDLDKPQSNHVGSVGDKTQMELIVVSVNSFSTEFGESNVYNLVDYNNNQITKFGTINKRYLHKGLEVESGSVVRFKATVKAHEVFRGVKKTTIGRVSKY